jgi:hypothetical protein
MSDETPPAPHDAPDSRDAKSSRITRPGPVEPFRAPWEHSRGRIERGLAIAEIVGFAVATAVLAKLAMESGNVVLASIAVVTGGAACWISARLAVRRFSKREPLPREDHAPPLRPEEPGDAFPMWILWTVGGIFLFGVCLLVTFGILYASG